VEFGHKDIFWVMDGEGGGPGSRLVWVDYGDCVMLSNHGTRPGWLRIASHPDCLSNRYNPIFQKSTPKLVVVFQFDFWLGISAPLGQATPKCDS